MENIQFYFLTAFLGLCAVWDVKVRKIPNWLLCIGGAAALFEQLYRSGLPGIFHFTGGMAVPLLLLSPLFLFHMLGAGDLKLLGVTGAFFGAAGSLSCMAYSILTAGIFALVKIIYHKSLIARLQYLANYINQTVNTRSILPYYEKEQGLSMTIPFAAAVFLSVWIYKGGLI